MTGRCADVSIDLRAHHFEEKCAFTEWLASGCLLFLGWSGCAKTKNLQAAAIAGHLQGRFPANARQIHVQRLPSCQC